MSKQPIQRKANKNGVVFCLCKDLQKNSFEVWKLCENYNGKIHGGLEKTWRYVEINMSQIQAEALFNRRVN